MTVLFMYTRTTARNSQEGTQERVIPNSITDYKHFSVIHPLSLSELFNMTDDYSLLASTTVYERNVIKDSHGVTLMLLQLYNVVDGNRL